MFTAASCSSVDLDASLVGAVIELGVELQAVLVLVFAIRLMITSRLSSGLPRQLS